MSWGASLTGLGGTLSVLDSLRMRFDGDTVYVVGPTVEYSVFVDRGTSRMESRPFVKPAAERVQGNLEGNVGDLLQGSVMDAGEDELVRATAIAVQREMQRIITQKGAVDTGTLRASVTVSKVK